MKTTRKSLGFSLIEVVICLAVMSVSLGVSLKGYQIVRRWLDYWNRMAIAVSVAGAFEKYYEYYGKHANAFPKNKWFDVSSKNYFVRFMGVMSDCSQIGANPGRIEFYRPTAEQVRTEKVRGSIYIYLKDKQIDRCANLMSQLRELTGGRSVPVDKVVRGEEVLWFVPR